MYSISPSTPTMLFRLSSVGMTPAPAETLCTVLSTCLSNSPHSRDMAYPHFRPLQYMVHMGSWKSLTGRPRAATFSHSSAIRTSPDDISFTRVDVEVASSSKRTGSERGSSCTAKLTWPRRWPKSVPVTFRPRDGVIDRWFGMLSHRHVGIIVGNEMTPSSERRRAEMLFRVLASRGNAGDESLGTSSLSEISPDSDEDLV